MAVACQTAEYGSFRQGLGFARAKYQVQNSKAHTSTSSMQHMISDFIFVRKSFLSLITPETVWA